ncbi:mechanosensitive ion channel protein MscS [Pseudomonas sp. Choline-3u-10]|jgi:small conductance mechanosensitive channel|uniref:mechanosensitive ion channel family protein n=1 Tax=Pseudomonadaceae TaxID=135621 RepID=UPI000C31BEA5|nr:MULTISPECIES: mechanosensitive ion channel domain-containing protein [Pseudomonadaceae]MAL91901.1 mechanosensitive ion channel protein MscS [Pseudomonas sp.]MBU0948149.1 mechanosensitive ion channel [Gammaproteobacteria bacterium]MBK3794598.1 mechanosensitive ion channel [Stutzerimonas stutzeri]MBK3879049.1 mechanosensitive ion channel [Stutzerimonas stutzeri]PKG91653.1 mechanosensitive ion channel protein MscS [Pseudomonas sp. Choline-3u-10]|tara:strand:+ start:851 stop:1675 length:825 start_codon:yes stop_codon:yes gene_type:complete
MDFSVDYLGELSEAWLPVVVQYGAQVTLALFTFLIGWWLINKIVGNLGGVLKRRQFDASLHGFIESLASVILKVLLLISVASMIGVETTSFIAVIGAAGLAIGLALQGSLGNFAGGVLILIFRPIRVGEWIEAQGVSGTVHSIQIFHTVLKSADNKTIVVPNGSLSNGHITNYSREPRRRADINIGIDYGADIKLARKILLEIAEDERVLRDPEPVVHVVALADSSVNLSLRVWVATGDFWPVTFGFTELVKERFDAAEIGIPFPQRVVHLVQR